ncbi:DUF4249 domain-containing protein [Spirosoma radiotolerans]|uniref:DUF4249 domain-containing protein n=1 Tax=Spirosoma radiotolerans TaxID=1379870 RepID=A0A0E3ZYS5_9BACT|nr:DUF4249 domain-containing protein [Spirosoma radiotolerans]AKD57619.1 hypothetical protein SD10_24695 [Spirosoma radiotolerans]
MRSAGLLLFVWLTSLILSVSCVDPEDLSLRGTVDLIVVDGSITNLAEPQLILLNRSKSDPLTGRFGTTPITRASVEVVIDSSQIISCHETVDGTYQLPNDFRGQVGHAYQLRFTLQNGTRYISSQQIMQPVPAIDKVSSRFNPRAISPPIGNFYTAGHELYIDFTDPVNERNFYRWDWKLWERQEWCKTCYQGIYSIFTVKADLTQQGDIGNIYYYTSTNTDLLEDCYYELTPPPYSKKNPLPEYLYDYNCRSQCWEIIYSHNTNVFDDQFSNGGHVLARKVANIPFYQQAACLAEIRQSSLTADAYRYFHLFQQQTQNTGGLADTPPTALIGNVLNAANHREGAVGYFTASAVSTSRYWLDRKDVSGRSLGNSDPANPSMLLGAELFFALNLRQPKPEPSPPYQPELYLISSPPRPPTAVCAPSNSKTPYRPEGWRD